MDDLKIRRRNRLKHHYTLVSNVIIFGYHELTDAEKLTYQAVDSFDWPDEKGNRKGYAYPSLRTIARLRNVDERTIRRHLARLEQVGLMTRELRVGRPSVLWIEEPSEEESQRYLSAIATGPDKDVRGGEDTDVRPNKKENPEQDKTVNDEQSSSRKWRRLSAEALAKREWLAGEILEVCKDEHSLGFYRKVAGHQPTQVIFETLGLVKELGRDGKIRRTKGAVFVDALKRKQFERG